MLQPSFWRFTTKPNGFLCFLIGRNCDMPTLRQKSHDVGENGWNICKSCPVSKEIATKASPHLTLVQGFSANKKGVGTHPNIAILKQLQSHFKGKREKGVGTPFPRVPIPLHPCPCPKIFWSSLRIKTFRPIYHFLFMPSKNCAWWPFG